MNTIDIDPGLIEEAYVAFISGITEKNTNGIKWDINGHTVYLTLENVNTKEITIVWPVGSKGHWKLSVCKGKITNIDWLLET